MNPGFTAIVVFVQITVCSVSAAWAQDSEARASRGPRVFLLDSGHLEAMRATVRSGSERFRPALAELERDARQALDAGPFTVVSKTILPPSGDKHDYISQGPYWWPNPDTPDGLPYVRRDGETNPEIRKHSDRGNLQRMIENSETLALAWYFTGDEQYAERAARLLRVWFLDAETRMNPHLRYGQGIPGRTDGRGIGLIETRGLTRVVDAAGLLAGSNAWTAADQRRLQVWFEQFLTWMLESSHGQDEAAARNNHGTYYDVQVASFALFVGKQDLARRVLFEVREKRIAAQIEPDGRQPHELARTKSWGYSVMNLGGMLQLAVLGEHVGVELWRYRAKDGRSIRRALEWLIPFATGRQRWTHQEIRGFDPSALYPLVRLAATRYGDEPFQKLAAEIPDRGPDDRSRLLRR